MKMALVWSAGGLLGGLLLSGCMAPAHRDVVVTPGGQVMVPYQPHGDFAKSKSVAGYAWGDGYYTYAHGQWVWVSGHWTGPPPSSANWVPGHWDNGPGGWVLTPGHWE